MIRGIHCGMKVILIVNRYDMCKLSELLPKTKFMAGQVYASSSTILCLMKRKPKQIIYGLQVAKIYTQTH